MSLDIKELISKVNIVEVISNFSHLLKAGSSYKTLCNVHGDKTPSLSINPRKQIYKCFVCDHGGDVLDYLIWAQKFSYSDALKYLITQAGLNVEDYENILNANKKQYSNEQIKLFNLTKDANALFRYYLDLEKESNHELKEFLNQRKLDKELLSKFSIGYAPDNDEYLNTLIHKSYDQASLINCSLLNESNLKPFYKNRIIFTIFDENNNPVAFSGRKINPQLDESPKYLNSKESQIFKKSKIVYNWANASKFDQIIIVEGFFDVIAFSRINMDNAIALMGTNLSNDHFKQLKTKKEILIFLDNDKAGINATLKIINEFLKNKIDAFVIKNDLNKDPDEIVNSQDGKLKLRELIEKNKIHQLDWLISISLINLNKNDSSELKTRINFLLSFVKYLDQLMQTIFYEKINQAFSINLTNQEINSVKSNNNNDPVVKFYLQSNITNSNNQKCNKEPINIYKILIWLYKNPSLYPQYSSELENINWFSAKYKKYYKSIVKYHLENEKISNELQEYLNEGIQKFNNASLPSTHKEVYELIERIKKEKIICEENYLDEMITKSNDSNQTSIFLSQKQKIVSKKIKE